MGRLCPFSDHTSGSRPHVVDDDEAKHNCLPYSFKTIICVTPIGSRQILDKVNSATVQYLVILCQCNLVLLGFKWYWVTKGLLCLYILKKINGDANHPTTDQLTNRANIVQSAFSKVRK